MLMPRVLSEETVDLFDTQQMIHRILTNILTEYRQTQICEKPVLLSVIYSTVPACTGTANQKPHFM